MAPTHFQLLFTEQALSDLKTLEKNNALKKRFKAVRKALAYLETNPRQPGLNTHKYRLNGQSVMIFSSI